jgi:hypothetical protein
MVTRLATRTVAIAGITVCQLEAEDWVLWMLAGLTAMTVAPLIAFVQIRRQPAAG